MARETFSPPIESSDRSQETNITRRKFLKYLGAVAGVAALEKVVPTALFAQERNAKVVERSKEEIWRDIQESIEKLIKKFGLQPEDFAIVVDPSHQELHLVRNNEIVKSYLVSTAKNGVGVEEESGKTPWGTHRIKEKIGDGLQLGTIIKARQDTSRIATIYTERVDVPRDDVTTRILWLDGQEGGVNKGKGIDSHARCIYIHGTPEEGLIGEPTSHGCVRMTNRDVIELFNLVPSGTLVEIQHKDYAASEKKE